MFYENNFVFFFVFFYIKHLHARVNIKFTVTSHVSTMICLGIKKKNSNSKKIKLQI